MAQISRRSLLRSGAITVGASMLGVHQLLAAAAPTLQFANDLDVLNYALTLEHLEANFYVTGLSQFGSSDFAFLNRFGIRDPRSFFVAIRDHEVAHVNTLIQVIQSLGGTPVPECTYNFGYSDVRGFVQIAQALENTGVSAYDGAIRFIQSPDLTEAAATIATVEARHAAFLNLLNDTSPFPAVFDDPKSRDEVLAIAGPFIVSCPDSGAAATGPVGTGVSITSPTANQTVSGSVPILGTAQLGSDDAFYKVEIMGGQFGNNWVTVGTTRTSSVNNGTLETLGPVAPGNYMVRVVVVGNNSNFSQVSAPISFTVR